MGDHIAETPATPSVRYSVLQVAVIIRRDIIVTGTILEVMVAHVLF